MRLILKVLVGNSLSSCNVSASEVAGHGIKINLTRSSCAPESVVIMDLPCVQWQDHVAQKWTRLDPESQERFTSLVEVDDVFKCASTLTT